MKKIILISISLFYLTIAILTGNAGNIASYALFLILPLSCIFFSAELGNWTGIMRFQKITSKSPAILVEIMGWILLLLPLMIGLINESSR